MATHIELCGPDTFQELMRVKNGYDEETVVRWCFKCGAVVIDGEYDGRIDPGRHMKIRYPNVSLNAWNALNKIKAN